METGRWHGRRYFAAFRVSDSGRDCVTGSDCRRLLLDPWCGKNGFQWRIFLRQDILYRIGALILTALEAVFIKKVMQLSSVELSFLS